MSSHRNPCRCNNTLVVVVGVSLEKVEGGDFEVGRLLWKCKG